MLIVVFLSFHRITYSNICLSFPDCHRAFAHFFSGVAKTDAQWRSIKSLHSEIPTLAEAFMLPQASLEELLIYCKLGMKRKGGFIFRPEQFKSSVINSFQLHEVLEVTKHTVDGFCNQQWFVRIGSSNRRAIAVAGSQECSQEN